MLDIKAAKEELSKKSLSQIERETAWKWASRAAASYEQVTDGPAEPLVAWSLGEEFYHEAIEHSSGVGDKGELLLEIKEAVGPYQEKAAKKLEAKLK